MANFDDRSNNNIIGNMLTRYTTNQSTTRQTKVIDTKNMTRVTVVMTYDTRFTDPSNVLVIDNLVLNEDDDIAFLNPTPVSSRSVIGSLEDLNFNSTLEDQAIVTVENLGFYNIKRYIRLDYHVDYVENINAPSVRVSSHYEFTNAISKT